MEKEEARIKRLCITDHIHDDNWMAAQGLRQPTLKPRDPSLWSKTPAEKEQVRKLKRLKYHTMKGSTGGRKYIPARLNLRVYVKGLEKTTFSLMCWQADIPSVLNHFKDRGGKVIKYQWNGKVYQPNEVPFRY